MIVNPVLYSEVENQLSQREGQRRYQICKLSKVYLQYTLFHNHWDNVEYHQKLGITKRAKTWKIYHEENPTEDGGKRENS